MSVEQSSSPSFETSATLELAYLANELYPGGFLHEMAGQLAEAMGQLDVRLETPDDVVAVFEEALKPKGPNNRARPRDEIIADIPALLEAMCNNEETSGKILSLAETVEIRQRETYPPAQLDQVVGDPLSVVLYARGAARRTGVLRPAVLEQALPLLAESGAVQFLEPVIWHFGAKRPVAPTRLNSRNEQVPNDEHSIVRGLVPDYLAADQTSSEYDNNRYLTLTQGFREVALAGTPAAAEQDFTVPSSLGTENRQPGTAGDVVDDWRAVDAACYQAELGQQGLGEMHAMHYPDDEDRPWRFAVQPSAQKAGAGADLAVMHQLLEGGLNGKQVVAGDSGLYRTSLKILIERWAGQNGVEFAAPPVIFGDEAGFSVDYTDANGNVIEHMVTPDRVPKQYLNEFLVIWKASRGARTLPPPEHNIWL